MTAPARRITLRVLLLPGLAATLAAGLVALTPGLASSAAAPTAINSTLTSVSCTSGTHCVAVGSFLAEPTGGSVYLTLAETWNGTAWTIVPTPTPKHPGGGAELNSVSCPSATMCVAVGESLTFTSGRLIPHPFAESWNGSTWTQAALPALGHSPGDLDGVSCTSPASCMAVGHEGTAKNPALFTLAESWNGTAWQFVATPPPPTPGDIGLDGVSCTGSACMAVGAFGYNTGTGTSLTLAERWNGTSWQRVDSPTPGSSGELSGVSCTAATACMAAGSDLGPANQVTLAEQWNGSKWTVRPSPNPKGNPTTGFDGVSCTGAAACMGTGSSVDSTGESEFTLAESWNGAIWSLLKPRSPGNFIDELLGVSCTGTSACVAVGDFQGNGNEDTLAETWNGTDWTVTNTPQP